MSALDHHSWRALIGNWATGVSVITAGGEDGPHGCTANALTSLSLDPLLLLVCFDNESNTLQAVRRSGRFCINILAAGQETLSRRFATKDTEGEKFRETEYEEVDGVPVLTGVLAWVVCQVEHEIPGGDHAIVVGGPLAGDTGPGDAPLIFFRSGYYEPGDISAA
jgi:flavin reductase (DIM6/NTAB) family NADH-FMN oxidoreductase RutF